VIRVIGFDDFGSVLSGTILNYYLYKVFICDKKKAIEADKGPERQNGEVVWTTFGKENPVWAFLFKNADMLFVKCW
jgi:hypothetical protein